MVCNYVRPFRNNSRSHAPSLSEKAWLREAKRVRAYTYCMHCHYLSIMATLSLRTKLLLLPAARMARFQAGRALGIPARLRATPLPASGRGRRYFTTFSRRTPHSLLRSPTGAGLVQGIKEILCVSESELVQCDF